MALSYSYTSILQEVRLALDPLRPTPSSSSSPTAVASPSPSPTQTSSTTAAAAMGYFQRFSSFPPSPTPSTSSKASSTNDSLLESRSFLSVFKAKANTFPLVRKPTVASLPKIAPPPTPPLNPEDNNNNNHLNALGLSYRLDPSTPLTAKSNDLLSWHRHQSPAEEYAAMPLQRREAALERVNKMRAWLSVPEKNLDSSTREWQSTTTSTSQKGHIGVGVGVVSRVTTPPSPPQSSRNKQLCQSDSPYCTIGATARQEQQPLAAHQRNDNSSFYSDVPKATTTTKKVFSEPCLQPAFSV